MLAARHGQRDNRFNTCQSHSKVVTIIYRDAPLRRNSLNELLNPFPFWVAAEQKGGQD